jgi:hypothetical protein
MECERAFAMLPNGIDDVVPRRDEKKSVTQKRHALYKWTLLVVRMLF